jgi:hypothetical protein
MFPDFRGDNGFDPDAFALAEAKSGETRVFLTGHGSRSPFL